MPIGATYGKDGIKKKMKPRLFKVYISLKVFFLLLKIKLKKHIIQLKTNWKYVLN